MLPEPACQQVRDALSARLDDEHAALPDVVVDGHLETCAACARHARALARLHGGLRVAPAMAVPDLTAEITAAVSLPTRARQRHRQRRWVLGLTGVVMALVALPGLVGPTLHVGREVAIFEVAVGAAVVAAAWQPRRLAAGVFPVAALVGGLVVGIAVVDLVRGATSLLAELGHLLPAVAAWLLWSLSRSAGGLVVGPDSGSMEPA